MHPPHPGVWTWESQGLCCCKRDICVFLVTASLGARWGEVRLHLQKHEQEPVFPSRILLAFLQESGSFLLCFLPILRAGRCLALSSPLCWFGNISTSAGAFPWAETGTFLREHSLACPTEVLNAAAIPVRVRTGVGVCGDKRDFKSKASPKAAYLNCAFISGISQGNYVNYNLFK